jgi:hypothetical protein
MPLCPDDRAELERRGIGNVRQRLDHAGPGSGSVVPGLGPNFGMTRSDVEDWLSEKDRAAANLQTNILWWAKAAAWISGASILVAVVIAALSYVFPTK